MEPPDLAAGPGAGQGVEHGQDRGRSHPGADQQDRGGPGLEDEGAARRGRVQLVARMHAGVHELAARTVRLTLDADPVGRGAREPGQRVAAHQGRAARRGRQPQGQELPRLGGGHGGPVRVGQVHRDHGAGFPLEGGHGQRPEPRPGRRRAHRDEPGVAGGPAGRGRLVQQGPERRLPAVRQGRDPQRLRHPLGGMTGQVEQGIDLGHGHGFRAGGDRHDLVASLHGALAQHPQVEPGAVVGDQQRRDLRVVHPDADPVAGDPGLGHLEQRLADLVAVADADLVIGQARDGEVLPELAVAEVVAGQLLLPVPVRVDLVHEHRPVLAAVPGQITLAVAVDVEPPHQLRAGDRPLPHRRVHGPALPGHVLRQADVHRQQAAGPLLRVHLVPSPAPSASHTGSP